MVDDWSTDDNVRKVSTMYYNVIVLFHFFYMVHLQIIGKILKQVDIFQQKIQIV